MSITEGIFESSIDLLSPGWFGVTLLSLSEAALCGLLKKQSGLFIQLLEKVRRREKERTEQNALHSQVQHRANILSINPILSPPSLAAAVLLSVFSSALITSAGVDPRVPPLDCLLLSYFIFPHIFLWSSPPLQQRRAPTQSTAAERSGNTTLSLTLFSPVMKLTCPAGHAFVLHEFVQLQTGSKSIDSLIACLPPQAVG